MTLTVAFFEVGPEELEQFILLPIVETTIKRVGGVREFFQGRAPGGEAVSHGPHDGDIIRVILTLAFAITAARAISVFNGVFQLFDSIVVQGGLQARPVLFLIDRQIQVRLEFSDPGVDFIGDLVVRRSGLLFRLRRRRFIIRLGD